MFATPGMLHAGLSLQIFKKWADDEKNMVCVSFVYIFSFFLSLYFVTVPIIFLGMSREIN